MRDVAIDRTDASKVRIGIGIALWLLAAYLMAQGWIGDGTSGVQPPVAIGALLSRHRADHWSARSSRVRSCGWPGRGCRRRAASPASWPWRTPPAARSGPSATASALLIGVTLVALLLVFGDSAKASIDKEVSRGFSGDFVVMSDAGAFAGLQWLLADDRRRRWPTCQGVDQVVAQTFAPAEITYDDGETVQQFLTSMDVDSLEGVFDVRMEDGDVTDLDDDGILVDVELAEAHDVEIGDSVHLLVMGGEELDLTVQGITDEEVLLGYFTITRDTYMASVPDPARLLRVRLDRRGRRPRHGDGRHRRDRVRDARPRRGGPRGLHRRRSPTRSRSSSTSSTSCCCSRSSSR